MRSSASIYGLLTSLALLMVLGPLAAMATAQTSEIPRRTVNIAWDSGIHDGSVLGKNAVPDWPVTSEIISEAGVPWMQLQFGDSLLGGQSRIEITSLLDGATQVLDAKSFEEWNNQSAYFNGDAVEVRLFVGASDLGTQVQVKSLVVGEWAAPAQKSICGSDDRTPSYDGRVARIDPSGCTAWVVSNGNLLTAGHCLAVSGNTTLSFNPPPSLPNGTVQFPGPEDQYAINQGSFEFANGGVGNDWGVFTVANNSQTGLQPITAQGFFRIRQDLGPSTIRITGFGNDSGSTNQTNQTHSGPSAGSSGTILRYAVDTMTGNSGSPVIDTATGEAVGIHTHGGCTSSGGNNHGTSFFNSAAWTEIHLGGWGPWWSLGTPPGISFASGPSVSSWAPGRLDVFARGSDNAIWFRSYAGNSWGPWWSLGGGLTSDPAAVSWEPGRIDVFARGLDNAIWFRSYTGSSWGSWWSLGTPPGISFASGPSVSSWAPGRLDVFARGSDNTIWFRSYDGSKWGAWWSLGGGLTSDPAAVSWEPARIDMFARGLDNAIWFRSFP